VGPNGLQHALKSLNSVVIGNKKIFEHTQKSKLKRLNRNGKIKKIQAMIKILI